MMVSVKKSKFRKILIVISVVIFAFCAISMAVTKIVYDSIFARYDEAPEIPPALETMVKERSVCQFPSGDNLLAGYYYGAPEPEQTCGLIVLVPGFHAGGDSYLWQISELRAYGWAVFTFDATGTLQSQGAGQVGFPQVVADLKAALEYVEKCDRFGYDEIVLMGHSRGAYAACCALKDAQNVAAVVSVSGINSAMEAIMQQSTNAVGPISYGNYGFLWLYQAMLFGTEDLEMDASQVISSQNVPVLVIHGTEDSQIPLDTSSIYSHREKITSSGVEYLLWEAGHTDLLFDADGTANDALLAAIHEFLIRSVAS